MTLITYNDSFRLCIVHVKHIFSLKVNPTLQLFYINYCGLIVLCNISIMLICAYQWQVACYIYSDPSLSQ